MTPNGAENVFFPTRPDLDEILGRTTFDSDNSLSKIRKCVDALLKMNIFRFGNLWLRQKLGVPIGGPIVYRHRVEAMESPFSQAT